MFLRKRSARNSALAAPRQAVSLGRKLRRCFRRYDRTPRFAKSSCVASLQSRVCAGALCRSFVCGRFVYPQKTAARRPKSLVVAIHGWSRRSHSQQRLHGPSLVKRSSNQRRLGRSERCSLVFGPSSAHGCRPEQSPAVACPWLSEAQDAGDASFHPPSARPLFGFNTLDIGRAPLGEHHAGQNDPPDTRNVACCR